MSTLDPSRHRRPPRRAAARWSGALLGIALATSPSAARSADEPTVAFHLRDQFGHVHDAADFRGRGLLLVAAARGGRTVGTAWVELLRALPADTAGAVPVVAVADLRGVPWLLRRVARAQFPDDRRQPVLLDWDGSLARGLSLDRDRCTVLAIGPDGRVVARLTPEAVDTLAAHAVWRVAQAATLPAAAAGSALRP